MNSDIQELLDAVQALGVNLRVEGHDLKIRPTGIVPADLKCRLKERKAEILERLQLEESMRRLEAADVLLAIADDGTLRLVQTEGDAHRAVLDGFTVYEPRDAYIYIHLTERERRMLHDFKRRFGGSMERTVTP